jgi:glycosyltransferase involved in cell wall biosynthesis
MLTEMRVALVLNEVAPYTHRVFEQIGQEGVSLLVLACCKHEPARRWNVSTPKFYQRVVLPGARYHRTTTQSIYFNPSVIFNLNKFQPNLVIIGGFSPTMIIAWTWARFRKRKVGISLDGWLESDPGLHSWLHRRLRRAMIHKADIAIGASQKSAQMLSFYGSNPNHIFVCPLVPAWEGPRMIRPFEERHFDILWCGHIDDNRKGVRFFVEVLERLADRIGPIRIVGHGPDESWLRCQIDRLGLTAQFDGFLQQEELESAYSSAKVFLMPSRHEPWGLVANEAAQCGTPILISNLAGAADEFIKDKVNGYVCALDVSIWVSVISELLRDGTCWAQISANMVRASKERPIELTVGRFICAFKSAIRGSPQSK